MGFTWKKAEVAALDRQGWHQSVAQCVQLDAGWSKVKVKVEVKVEIKKCWNKKVQQRQTYLRLDASLRDESLEYSHVSVLRVAEVQDFCHATGATRITSTPNLIHSSNQATTQWDIFYTSATDFVSNLQICCTCTAHPVNNAIWEAKVNSQYTS